MRSKGQNIPPLILLIEYLFHDPFGLLPLTFQIKMIVDSNLFESFLLLHLALRSLLLILRVLDDSACSLVLVGYI